MLIVDDEPMNVLVIKSLLEVDGVQADVAYCGNEGVQHIIDRVNDVCRGGAQMYKIIFLDYSMPDMEGP